MFDNKGGIFLLLRKLLTVCAVCMALFQPVICYAYEKKDDCGSLEEQEGITQIGFASTLTAFHQSSGWSSAPDRTVLSPLPGGQKEVSLTYSVPGARTVQFGFYTRSPFFCSPNKSNPSQLTVGPSRESASVSGTLIDASSLIPLRYSPELGQVFAWYGGNCWLLQYSMRDFAYQLVPAPDPSAYPSEEEVPGYLVQLSVSRDGVDYVPVAYSLTQARSQLLEQGGNDYCYYICEARLPDGVDYVKLSLRDCPTCPTTTGSVIQNAQYNRVFLASVSIDYAGTSPLPSVEEPPASSSPPETPSDTPEEEEPPVENIPPQVTPPPGKPQSLWGMAPTLSPPQEEPAASGTVRDKVAAPPEKTKPEETPKKEEETQPAGSLDTSPPATTTPGPRQEEEEESQNRDTGGREDYGDCADYRYDGSSYAPSHQTESSSAQTIPQETVSHRDFPLVPAGIGAVVGMGVLPVCKQVRNRIFHR